VSRGSGRAAGKGGQKINASMDVSDLGTAVGSRAPSTRAAAKNNTAIHESDASSGLSPVKKKGKRAPTSPLHVAAPRDAPKNSQKRKKVPFRQKAALAGRKRLQDDADFDGDVNAQDQSDADEEVDSLADEPPASVVAAKAAGKPKPARGKQKGVGKVVASLAAAAPAVAAVRVVAGLTEVEETLRLVILERQAGRCTCALVGKLAVKDLKLICLQQNPPVVYRHRVDRQLKDMRKKEILVELCVVCTSEAEVVAAMASAGFLQGVAPKFWNPRIVEEALSPLTAFHFALQRNGNLEENADIRDVLNEFRAHFAKMLSTNFRFYVVEGKINKMDDVGQLAVLHRVDKFANFVHSVKSAFNHYRGIHSDMTCGRLRKALVCTPFRLFQNCDARVQCTLKRFVEIFLRLIMDDDELLDITAVYHDQDKLNRAFALYLRFFFTLAETYPRYVFANWETC
jgi:hypothetical protein